MKTRIAFLLLLSCAACDGLASRPGDDFRVRVQAPEIQIVQRVAPYDFEFAMEGCDDFVADLTVAGGSARRIEPKPLGNGRFTASVPLDLLHNTDDYCLYDSEKPQVSGVQLAITCRQDERVQVDNFRVTYAPAWRATSRGRGPVDAVFAGDTDRPGHRFFNVGSGWLDDVKEKEVDEEVVAALSPGEPPLLAASGNTVHLWSGCPVNDCGFFWFVDTPTVKKGHNASFVQTFDWDVAGRASFVRNVRVPSSGMDLVPEGQGSLLLSRTTTSAVVTRVEGETATVLALLEGEVPHGKFGRLDTTRVFVTTTPNHRTRLRRADGTLVAEQATPGSSAEGEPILSLAPTGDAWVTIRRNHAWLSRLDGSTVVLPTELEESSDTYGFGAAWTTSGVAIHDRKKVELFTRARDVQTTRTWAATVAPSGGLRAAAGMGDSLAVLTASGLQIFDAEGRLSGGADPMPQTCALNYEAQHMAVLSPEVVVLAGRRASYQFRIGVTTATTAVPQ